MNLKGATGGTFTVNGVETLNISSAQSSNTVTIANNSHETINISGDKALTLVVTDGANTVETIDASALTGALTLSGTGTTDLEITGGSANDIITVVNFDLNDTVNGGAGNADVLATATAITAANAVGVSNIEQLETTLVISLKLQILQVVSLK